MDLLIIIANVIALGAIFYFWKRSRKPKKLESYSKTEHRIENVEVGGVIHISLMEDSYEDYDLVITDRHQYQSGKDFWYELVGDNARTQIAIDYEEGDELLVSIQLQKLTFQELPLNRTDLDDFDDTESGSFNWGNKTFTYKDSGKATFFQNCNQEKNEDFYYWEFATSDDKYFISCEQWDDDSIEVTYSKKLPKSSLEVYSLKE